MWKMVPFPRLPGWRGSKIQRRAFLLCNEMRRSMAATRTNLPIQIQPPDSIEQCCDVSVAAQDSDDLDPILLPAIHDQIPAKTGCRHDMAPDHAVCAQDRRRPGMSHAATSLSIRRSAASGFRSAM